MSSLDDISTCGDGDNGDKISTNKKECTSYDQKAEDIKNNETSNREPCIISTKNLRSGTTTNDNEDDKLLFQDPPPKEDCQICMQPMPYSSGACGVGKTYMACCGKEICSGCSEAENDEIEKGNIKAWCALCRVPVARSDEENIKRLKNRCEQNDAEAYLQLGHAYTSDKGLPQNFSKTIELWSRSAGLGSINAHYNLGVAYYNGRGVEKDIKKAIKHFKLAAIRGHERARYILGLFEEENGNIGTAMKHYMIVARAGYDESLKKVGKGYKEGHVTKDDYAKTLRYQASVDEMKSEQRTKAAAMQRD